MLSGRRHTELKFIRETSIMTSVFHLTVFVSHSCLWLFHPYDYPTSNTAYKKTQGSAFYRFVCQLLIKSRSWGSLPTTAQVDSNENHWQLKDGGEGETLWMPPVKARKMWKICECVQLVITSYLKDAEAVEDANWNTLRWIHWWDLDCGFGGLPPCFFSTFSFSVQWELCREVGVEGALCCVSLRVLFPRPHVWMCTPWPPSHCPDVSNGGQRDREGIALCLAFLRSGITGEMEEAITWGNVSSVLVVGVLGNAATPLSSPL